MENKEQPGYKISQILLIHSRFERTDYIDFPNLVIEQSTNIDISDNPEEPNKFTVGLNVILKGNVAETNAFEINVRMIGGFEKIGEPEHLPEDSFKKINAPAIIYPFCREHIYTVAAKAGLGDILLQPINFTSL